MSGQVRLTVLRGKHRGKRFLFNEPTMCMIGRGRDCLVHLPDDERHRTISRHHCVLEIDPPRVRIRDLASRNGTFVNGAKIGQRPAGLGLEDPFYVDSLALDLEDGDAIRVGPTTFQLRILTPAFCVICDCPLSDEERDQAEWAAGVFVCEKCRDKGEAGEGLESRSGSAVVG